MTRSFSNEALVVSRGFSVPPFARCASIRRCCRRELIRAAKRSQRVAHRVSAHDRDELVANAALQRPIVSTAKRTAEICTVHFAGMILLLHIVRDSDIRAHVGFGCGAQVRSPTMDRRTCCWDSVELNDSCFRLTALRTHVGFT
jgi:hypothetical protein